MSRLPLACAFILACWLASCSTTDKAPVSQPGATQQPYTLPRCANRFASDLDQVTNKQDGTDVECYRQLSSCTSDTCASELSACRFGCQKALQDQNVDFALRSAMAASHKKCLDGATTSQRAACGRAQMECARQAKNDAGEVCREGHHVLGSCDKTYADCRLELDKCLAAYVPEPLDVPALTADSDHQAYSECMATESKQWPLAAPPLEAGAGDAGVKVVPFMAPTCWESAAPLPATVCGPRRPCGADVSSEYTTCYVVRGIPMCCTYCPVQWSADC